MHELDIFRQQILEAMLVNGVGVSATHLHELYPPPVRQALDLSAQTRDTARLTVLINESHRHATASIRIASASCTSSRSVCHSVAWPS